MEQRQRVVARAGVPPRHRGPSLARRFGAASASGVRRLWALCTVVALSLALWLAGCGTGVLGEDDVAGENCSVGNELPVSPPDNPARAAVNRVHVFLLRGLNNTYSLGLDRLASRMRGLNLPAEVVNWPAWETAAQDVVAAYPDWPPGSQIVLVGHSYGADDAIRAARFFQAHDVSVKSLVLLDASAPDPVPSNVERCTHFYIPTIFGDVLPQVFAGNPVVPETGNGATQILNIPFTPDNMGAGVGCANHFSIDVNTLAHNLVISEVLYVVDPDAFPDPFAPIARDGRARPPETPSP